MGLRKKKDKPVEPTQGDGKRPVWVDEIISVFNPVEPEQEWHQHLSMADLIAMYNYADQRMQASKSVQAVWNRWADRKMFIKKLIDAMFIILDDEIKS